MKAKYRVKTAIARRNPASTTKLKTGRYVVWFDCPRRVVWHEFMRRRDALEYARIYPAFRVQRIDSIHTLGRDAWTRFFRAAMQACDQDVEVGDAVFFGLLAEARRREISGLKAVLASELRGVKPKSEDVAGVPCWNELLRQINGEWRFNERFSTSEHDAYVLWGLVPTVHRRGEKTDLGQVIYSVSPQAYRVITAWQNAGCTDRPGLIKAMLEGRGI